MKLALRLSALLLSLALLPGCVYGNFGHPLDIDVDNTQFGTKVGESSMYSVAWLVAWGDSGVHAACQEAGITTVKHLDSHTTYVLFGLYYKNTTIVYGD